MNKLVLTGAAAVFLLAGSSASFAADKKTLAFVVNGASDFWKAAEAGVKKAQGELPNYNLVFKYPEQASAAIQIRLMDDLVAAGAAGIMVSSADPKTSDRQPQPYRQTGRLVHHRQRCARYQPGGLHRVQQHRRRQAGRPVGAEGASQWRKMHGLCRPARRRQRQGAHPGRQGHHQGIEGHAGGRSRRRHRPDPGQAQCRGYADGAIPTSTA